MTANANRTQESRVPAGELQPRARWGLPAVFGPTFRKEFWIACRRKRSYLLRALYLGALGCAVYVTWLSYTIVQGTGSTPLGELALLGETLFNVYAWTQFVLLCLIAPIEAAGLVYDERRQRTLELLFVTPLAKSAILVGAFLSRMLKLQLLILAGLPVIACVLLFGGASPAQVVLTALVTSAASLLAGAVGFLCSTANGTRSTPPAGAVAVVFLLYSNMVYGLISLIDWWLTGNPSWDPTAFWGFWATPPFALATVAAPAEVPGLPGPFGMSAWATSVVVSLLGTALFVMLTVLLVRRSPGPRAGIAVAGKRRVKKRRWFRRRRPIGKDVVFWREIASRIAGRFDRLVKMLYVAVIVVSYAYLFARYGPGVDKGAFCFMYLTVELVALFLGAFGLAGRAIVTERSDPTFALLLATPVTAGQIVLGKTKAILRYLDVYIIMPMIHVVIAVALGMLRPEALVTVPLSVMAALVVLVAACVFLSLRVRKVSGVVGWFLLILFLAYWAIPALCSLAFFALGIEAQRIVYFVMVLLNPFAWISTSISGAFPSRWGSPEYLLFSNFSLSAGGYVVLVIFSSAAFLAAAWWLLRRTSGRLDTKFGRCP